jgi:hypothetical protein
MLSAIPLCLTAVHNGCLTTQPFAQPFVTFLHSQVVNVRAERDAEIRGMAARLEATVASAGRSVGEAEQHLASQEALMARWREEAQMVGLVCVRQVRAGQEEPHIMRLTGGG